MNKGISLALVTAAISGVSIFSSKLFVADMDPVVYTTLKNGLVAIVLTALILTPTLRSNLSKLKRNDWTRLLLIGVIGGSIPFALFFTGLKISESANAAIIHKTLFIWVAALAIPYLKERINTYQAIGYILVLLGVISTAGLTFQGDTGEQLIFAATILWAVENIIAKQALSSIPSEIVAWARMSFGVVILSGVVIAQGNAPLLFNIPAGQVIPLIVATVLLIGYVLTWYKALSHAPATVVSSILVLSTPITALLSGTLMLKPLPDGFALSSMAILAGIAAIAFIPSLRLKSH